MVYFFMMQEEMQCLNCVSHVSWNLKLPFHVFDVISEFLVSREKLLVQYMNKGFFSLTSLEISRLIYAAGAQRGYYRWSNIFQQI